MGGSRRRAMLHRQWRPWLSCGALAVLVWAILWPARARWLTTWDSVMFALAMEEYDVSALRPHAPGYPIYVAAARLVHPLAGDANTALVILSIAAVAGAVLGLYLVGRRMFGEGSALAAALLLALCPVTVWNGRIATSYPFDALWSVAVAGAAWWVMQRPSHARIAVLALTFAVALGFRQSLLLFLGPLVAYAVLADRPLWRVFLSRVGTAAAVAIPSVMAWFAPMAASSGGFTAWRQANALQSGDVVFRHTVYHEGVAAWNDLWPRFVLYLRAEIRFLLPAVVIALGILAWIGWRRRVAFPVPRRQALFLAVWALPATLFYLTVFNGWDRGPAGYILVILPVIALAATATIVTAARAVAHAWGTAAGALAAIALLAIPITGYVGLYDEPIDYDIDAHDAWAAAWAELPTRFPSDNSTILASHSWAHVWYHLPDHVSYGYTPIPDGMRGPAWTMLIETHQRVAARDWYDAIWQGPDGTRHPLPEGTRNIVVFDFQLAGENEGQRVIREGVEIREAWLHNGWRVLYVEVTNERYLEDFLREPVNIYP